MLETLPHLISKGSQGEHIRQEQPVYAVARLCMGVHRGGGCVYAAQPQLPGQSLCKCRVATVNTPSDSNRSLLCMLCCQQLKMQCGWPMLVGATRLQPSSNRSASTCHDVAHEAGVFRLAPGQPHRSICCTNRRHQNTRADDFAGGSDARLDGAHRIQVPMQHDSWTQSPPAKAGGLPFCPGADMAFSNRPATWPSTCRRQICTMYVSTCCAL